ncbi:alpha/beta fold hydrolase [Niabella beijingensis]|uniref:alpha/beta hydrolase family protein n=1 Tax=Niabella beijingensis TaxID=2872700 RepID=UPI001CC08726|nr:alpha/beta fold hydrolase [Niabella beijingensis]MBZ4189357.1 alpha/beta fold hydrolase [Niabella beijingensis]
MSTKIFKLFISKEIGVVSAKYMAPANPKCMLTLAHGAGAGMDHSFMEGLATALSKAGIASFRFNFPFSENKKRRPDSPPAAHQTIASAITKAHELHPKLPLFVAGKSFGGRMSSQYLSAYPKSAVKGIIFYGFPLHPSSKPSTDRADHLKTLKIPTLFLQGSKDALAMWALIEPVCKSLKKATLVRFEGADHSFKAGKTNIIPLLVEETNNWIEKTLNNAPA